MYIEMLRKIDEDAKVSAGQVAAWLTSKEEAISTSFNPAIKPLTKKQYYFHVGILPQDARLIVEQHGMLHVPLERSVSIPIVDDHFDEPLSLENEIRPYNSFDRDLTVVEDRSGIEVSMWDKNVEYPVVFGDKAVQELFDKHELEEDPEIVKALETLTATLF